MAAPPLSSGAAGGREPGAAARGLEALWRGHAAGWRRLLSRRIRDEIELRARFDLELLSPGTIQNLVPPGTVPDCPRCEDVCCAGWENLVSLRLVDVARLVDLGRTDLMSKRKPRFPEAVLAERPQLRELSESQLFRALPVMRQIGEARVCAALTAELRCSLYPSWPLSCERFPYTLSAARRSLHWGTRCPVSEKSAEQIPRSREIAGAAIAAYNERVRDAVLITHGRAELDALGIGAWITGPDEDPFEPPPRLPVLP